MFYRSDLLFCKSLRPRGLVIAVLCYRAIYTMNMMWQKPETTVPCISSNIYHMKREFLVKAVDSYKVYNVYMHRFYADQLLFRKFKNFDLNII